MIYRFQFKEVFPPDDVLGEWIVTLAMAFNDLALVHVRLEEDSEDGARFLYWLRVALGHFNESANFLHNTAQIEQVEQFLASLSSQAREHYEAFMALSEGGRGTLARLRSTTAFHYPELRVVEGMKKPRTVQRVLRALAARNDVGLIEKGDSGTVREGRLLFADEVVAVLVTEASGGADAIEEVHREISEAIREFMRFTNHALDAYFATVVEGGVRFDSVAERP